MQQKESVTGLHAAFCESMFWTSWHFFNQLQLDRESGHTLPKCSHDPDQTRKDISYLRHFCVFRFHWKWWNPDETYHSLVSTRVQKNTALEQSRKMGKDPIHLKDNWIANIFKIFSQKTCRSEIFFPIGLFSYNNLHILLFWFYFLQSSVLHFFQYH